MSNNKDNGNADTVRDIAEEMLNTSIQDITAKVIYGWATRLAACEQSVTDCNHLGNAAAMRKALKETQSVIEKCSNILRYIPDGCEYDEILDEVADNLYELQKTHVKPALSAPPRNCDRFSTAKEAGEAFISEACENPCGNCTVSDECHNPLVHECGIDWLFSEAKGETK